MAVLVDQENTQSGTTVFLPQAFDPDTNSKLVFSWSPGREKDTMNRFSISKNSGGIITSGNTAFPKNSIFRLSIRVEDVNSQIPTKSYADLELLVYTAFQNVQLPKEQFVISFAENSPIGTLVGPIPAKSLNYVYDPVSFSIIYQPPANQAPIVLNANNKFVTQTMYDYETAVDKIWPYLIQATENGTFASQSLMLVTLTDVDDNPPFFKYSLYVTNEVSEDVAFGTIIYKILPDDLDTLKPNYAYSLSGDGSSLFRVFVGESGEALILTNGRLNYDNMNPKTPFYDVTLTATGVVSGGSASTVIRVMMKNANTYAPTITSQKSFNLSIEAVLNIPVYVVTAVDLDGSAMSYHFINSGSISQTFSVFTINSQNGQISLTSRPTIQVYSLQIVVRDSGTCPGCVASGLSLNSEVFNLDVRVFQMNKYMPKFTNCPSLLSQVENSPANSVIGKVEATDEDDTELARTKLVFSMVENSVFKNPTNYLNVNPTDGTIYNVKPLSRSETFFDNVLPNQLYFTIRVDDWGEPMYSRFCYFKLDINDVNINLPIFNPSSYDVVLLANTNINRQIAHLIAWDADDQSQDTSKVLYRIVSQTINLFSINQNTGQLSMNGNSGTGSFKITVEAYNPEPTVTKDKWNVATVNVYTTSNPNDLPPDISVTGIFKFNEDESNKNVAVISTSIPNGANYQINLFQFPGSFEATGWTNSPRPFTNIVSNSDKNPQLTLVTGNQFLYQRLSTYYIRIRAQKVPKTADYEIYSDIVLTFEILDVNNQIPQFPNQIGRVYLIETAQPNALVTNIFAFDTDTVAQFKSIKYSLAQTGDYQNFKITGTNILVGDGVSLNAETKSVYFITVLAKDEAPSSLPSRNGEPNTASLVITINLINVNNNAPVFSTVFTFNVDEKNKIGSDVGKVEASDKDPGTIFTYYLSGTGSENFVILSHNGEVKLAKVQDSTTTNLYTLTLFVNDQLFTAQTTLRVQINKNNIRLCTFNQAGGYTYSIQELTTGSLTPSPLATDPSINPSVEYQIGGYYSTMFTISSTTGSLSVSNGLVRDLPTGRDVYSFSIGAKNSVGVTFTQISVTVTDINNKPPRWTYPSNVLFYPENSGTSTFFATLNANDADLGQNAQSEYALVGVSNLFRVNTLGQVISTQNYVFDNEKGVVQSFTLPVTATNKIATYNQPTNFMSSTDTILILVKDVNNNPPVFIDGNDISISYPENIAVNYDGYILLTRDPDVVNQRRLTCSLVNQNSYFNVQYIPDVDGCGIRPQVRLDLSAQPTVPPVSQQLTVQVSDGTNSAQIRVLVNVIRANNVAPTITFLSSINNNRLQDGMQAPLKVGSVAVTSPYMTNNKEYSIRLSDKSSANGLFYLSKPINGNSELTLMRDLSRDEVFQLISSSDTSPTGQAYIYSNMKGPIEWPMKIIAYDANEPIRSSTTTFTLTIESKGPVIEINKDNPITISNQATTGSIVGPGFISAKDPDNPEAVVNYAIAPNNPLANSLFKLEKDPNTNNFRLITKTKIDRDQLGTSEIALPIISSITVNGATKLLTSTVTVAIEPNGLLNDPVESSNTAIVHIPQNWYWPYLNAVQDLPVAVMPLNEKFSVDRKYREFKLNPQNDNDLAVRVTLNGIVYLKSASPPGVYKIDCTVSTPTKPSLKTTTSSLKLTVKWLPPSAFNNGLLFRINGIKLDEFMNIDPNQNAQSCKNGLQSSLSHNLGVNNTKVSIFPTAGASNYVDVYTGVESSPYQLPANLRFQLDQQTPTHNQALLTGIAPTTASLATLVIPTETSSSSVSKCSTEIESNGNCGGFGCTNQYYPLDGAGENPAEVTNVDSLPFEKSKLSYSSPYSTGNGPIVNSNITCGCTGVKQDFPFMIKQLTCKDPNACYNDGACQQDVGTLSTYCICDPSFYGPKCQRHEIGFNSPGYALVKGIGACSELHIRFEFITSTIQNNALLFYVGPYMLKHLNNQVTQGDYLAIEAISENLLKVSYDLGAGVVTGTLDTTGSPSIYDSRWHTIDAYLTKENNVGVLYLTLDSCLHAKNVVNNKQSTFPDYSNCQGRYPYTQSISLRSLDTGLNPIQIGGRSVLTEPTYPQSISNIGFIGQFMNLYINGELADLYQRNTGQNFVDKSNVISTKCFSSLRNQPQCNIKNSYCSGIETALCVCKPGFTGDYCDTQLTAINLDNTPSYEEVILRNPIGLRSKLSLQIQFRTRTPTGTILFASGNTPLYYSNSTLEILLINGQVKAIGNFGDFVYKELILRTPPLNDGQWHTIKLDIVLSSFWLSVDFGTSVGYSSYLPVLKDTFYNQIQLGNSILIGARRDVVPGENNPTGDEVSPASSNLYNSCFRDLRMNEISLPISYLDQTAFSTKSIVSEIRRSRTTTDGCRPNDACPINGVTCPGDLTCQPSWRPLSGYVCGCQNGSVAINDKCFELALCSKGLCQNGAVCQLRRNSQGYVCICPDGYTGINCEIIVLNAGLGIAALVALGLMILLVLLLLIIFFCLRRRKKSEKFLPPDREVRENIVNYFETAGETDISGFDTTKLAQQTAYFPQKIPTVDTIRSNDIYHNEDSIYMNPADLSGIGPMLAERTKRVDMANVPDCTLDYGYEGENVLSEYESTGDYDKRFLFQ